MQKGNDRVRKDKIITYSLWTVSILWMGFCLFLSWQTGEDTARLSGNVAQAVKRVIHIFGVEVDLNDLHAWLRKAAHIVTFFVSGVLFCCSFQRSLKHSPHSSLYSFPLSAAFCSLCAIAAEVCKIWIQGRHLQWDEAVLNVAGAICGAGIAALIRAFFSALTVKKR